MDLQLHASNEHNPDLPKHLATQSISLGSLIFHSSEILEVIPKQGHFKPQEVEAFIEARNSFFDAPYKMLYNATAKHSYSYAALETFAKKANSNLIAVYCPDNERHTGFDSLLSFCPDSAYHYFSDYQEALAWLKAFE